MAPRGKGPASSAYQASQQSKQPLVMETIATMSPIQTGKEYIESLDNFLVNLDLSNLEWLPQFDGSTSFHVFPIQSADPDSPRRELEFWMTGKIRSSNLAEKKPTEWILDLFVDDLTSNAFDNLIATG